MPYTSSDGLTIRHLFLFVGELPVKSIKFHFNVGHWLCDTWRKACEYIALSKGSCDND